MGYLINVTSSGIYTPTLSNAQDAASNPILINAFYSQINNIITCSINGDIDVDFSSNINGTFDFTLPINTLLVNAIGVVTVKTEKTCNGSIFGNIITLRSDDTTLISSIKFFAIFQYSL
jgi:hypothetical protein